MIDVRLLAPGDEPLAEAFLAKHADASMFLRSNLRAAGLADAGRMREGTWAAALERGEIVGVVAHWWNGVIGVQAPHGIAELVQAVSAATRGRARAVLGLAGPLDQVIA
ncbi:MAG: GNAT family N-acetyltransferase, partial [Myxococcota bacterium]|nr:GNAT family N-acetyltransferase [Myxococcota bacterium]